MEENTKKAMLEAIRKNVEQTDDTIDFIVLLDVMETAGGPLEAPFTVDVDDVKRAVIDLMDDPSIYKVSEYLEDNGYNDDVRYELDEWTLNDLLYDVKPYDLIQMLDSSFDVRDEMFGWDGWGELVSCSESDYIDEWSDEVKEWMYDEGDFDDDTLQFIAENAEELCEMFTLVIDTFEEE